MKQIYKQGLCVIGITLLLLATLVSASRSLPDRCPSIPEISCTKAQYWSYTHNNQTVKTVALTFKNNLNTTLSDLQIRLSIDNEQVIGISTDTLKDCTKNITLDKNESVTCGYEGTPYRYRIHGNIQFSWISHTNEHQQGSGLLIETLDKKTSNQQKTTPATRYFIALLIPLLFWLFYKQQHPAKKEKPYKTLAYISFGIPILSWISSLLLFILAILQFFRSPLLADMTFYIFYVPWIISPISLAIGIIALLGLHQTKTKRKRYAIMGVTFSIINTAILYFLTQPIY